MGWGTGNLGGGSGGLNFKVVSYTTESELLADTPKENTIGIITTNKITAWLISPVQPASLLDGAVWISTGTSSAVPFNALKSAKQAIHIYPIHAKQYISGAWVDLTAKSYQGGDWVDWFVTLPVSLDKWKEKDTTAKTTLEYADGTLSYTVVLGTGWSKATLEYTDLINCSVASTLTIFGSGTITEQAATSKHQIILTDGSNVVLQADISSFDGEFSVDISGLSGSYYLQIYSYVGAYSSTKLQITGIEVR